MHTQNRSEGFSQERYDSWRRSIPYTNEEIAEALEELSSQQTSRFLKIREDCGAAAVRRGRLSSYLYVRALSVLVKKCALCGKKALYRYQNSGRCSVHRHIQTLQYKKYAREQDSRNGALATQQLEEGKQDLNKLKHHRAVGVRKKRSKNQ